MPIDSALRSTYRITRAARRTVERGRLPYHQVLDAEDLVDVIQTHPASARGNAVVRALCARALSALGVGASTIAAALSISTDEVARLATAPILVGQVAARVIDDELAERFAAQPDTDRHVALDPHAPTYAADDRWEANRRAANRELAEIRAARAR